MRSEFISQRLKLRQLRIFLAVGQTGSMARAAKQLATSQSVISKTIGELEELLGVRLVDRRTHGIELTVYGKALLARSIVILDGIRTGVDELGTLTDAETGELRIGTAEPQAGIVVRAIELLSGRYPGIDFKVVVGSGLTLVDRELRGRQIDLVLGVMPEPAEEDLEAIVLYHNRMRVVVGMKSRWARRNGVQLADLVGEPWCAPPSDYISGAFFLEAFRKAGLPMHKMRNGTFVIERVVRGHWPALEREKKIRECIEVDYANMGRHYRVDYRIVIEVEPGSGGKESAETTIRNLAGYNVVGHRPTGPKEVRAEPFAAQVQGGNVWLVAGPWNEDFLEEAEAFPNGVTLDQLDAAAMAFNHMTLINTYDTEYRAFRD